jgi:hypothetical protein
MKKLLLILAACFCIIACGDSNLQPGYDPNYDAQAPKTTEESHFNLTRANARYYQGKHSSGFHYFGQFKASQAALDGAARGIQRTYDVLAQEYAADADKLNKIDHYAVVFYKPSPLCKSAPAFTVSYVQMDPNDPYAQSEYDLDPRLGRVTICAAGKMSVHTWLQNKPDAVPFSTVDRIDLVEDPAMSEAAARHEALHHGLNEVDKVRGAATLYHGGDWEQILAKVDGRQSLAGGKAEVVRIRGIVDDEEQEFSVILVK